jgi:hypothetical protein
MLSDYERELSTHYAQVRKRLRGEPPKRIMAIPHRQKDITSPSDVEPTPVVGPETEQKPDFVLYVNEKPFVRTLVFAKRDFLVIENEPKPEPPTVVFRKPFCDVLRDVSRETGVPSRVLLGKRRMHYIVEARRLLWWRAAQECPHLSIADIGRRSNVDHTSVLHGLKKYAELNGLPYARGSVE